MTITERTDDAVTILGLQGSFMGELDGSRFQEKKFHLIEANHVRVVLDMTELTMINSSGLGSLIAALVSTRERGGDVRLAGLNKTVAYVIEKVHLDTTFRIFETVADAAASFNQLP